MKARRQRKIFKMAGQAVALAIDQAGGEEIIGTVGGDEPILVVIKPKQLALSV